MKVARNKGFTLVELLTTFAIISILTAISLPAYASLQQNVALGNAAQEIVGVLRQAQGSAMAGQGGVDHGVHFQNAATTYSSFSGTWAAPVTPPVAHQLPKGVTVASVTPTPDVVFTKLSGASTSVTIVLSGFSRTKTITVAPIGTINLQ
jgi:prepilin-type N-terminal cleavage/methylation domain-containing protein